MTGPSTSFFGSPLVLKDEWAATVEVVSVEGVGVVFKTYRNPRLLLWRTFLQRSRAEREFTNLHATFDAGVASVEPLGWNETRWFGCVEACWIATRFVPSARPVRDLLGPPALVSPRERRELARRIGRLLRELHLAGVLWCTMTPRNLLLSGDPYDGILSICDMPKAVRFRRSLVATRRARIDLFDACFSRQRLRQLGHRDRHALLLEYAAGDRLLARRLWLGLRRRSRMRNRLERSVLVSIDSYVLPALGRLIGRTPPRPTTVSTPLRHADDDDRPGSALARAADAIQQAGQLRLRPGS
jgi:hypothetical protein